MQQLALRVFGKPLIFHRASCAISARLCSRPSLDWWFSVESPFEAIYRLFDMSRPKVSSTVAGIPSKRLMPLQ